MNRKYVSRFTLLLIGFPIGLGYSQTVISTAGDHFDSGSEQLSWTVGEMVTATLSTSEDQLTQGFHQGLLVVVGVPEVFSESRIEVFPNPTRGNLSIQWQENPEPWHVTVVDITGKMVFNQSFSQFESSAELDFSLFANGLYILRLTSGNLPYSKQFKILKSH